MSEKAREDKDIWRELFDRFPSVEPHEVKALSERSYFGEYTTFTLIDDRDGKCTHLLDSYKRRKEMRN